MLLRLRNFEAEQLIGPLSFMVYHAYNTLPYIFAPLRPEPQFIESSRKSGVWLQLNDVVRS
jgi:hypothetical protein